MSTPAKRAELIDYMGLVRRMDPQRIKDIARRGRDEPASVSDHERRIVAAYALLNLTEP